MLLNKLGLDECKEKREKELVREGRGENSKEGEREVGKVRGGSREESGKGAKTLHSPHYYPALP